MAKTISDMQKARLTEHIYKLLKESINENPYFENFFREKKEKSSDEDRERTSAEIKGKEEAVLKWLNSAQELHSVLAYELWPNKDRDSARSEFSKKYRGHDDDGKEYHFDDVEINTLYNMRDDFISRAGLDDLGKK